MNDIIKTILEFLKIIVSWPFVVLVIFLLLFRPLRELILSLKKREAEIPTPWGAVRLLPPATDVELPPVKAEKEIDARVDKISEILPRIRASVAEVEGENNTWGAGFIVDKKGLLLTAAHVIGDQKKVLVYFQGRERKIEASVVAIDQETSSALLELTSDDYSDIKIAEYSLGEQIYSVSPRSGTNYGFIESGYGIVSIDKDKFLKDTFVTTLSSRPGDSGTPIINKDGEAVGMVIALMRAQSGDKTIAVPTIEAMARLKK